MKRKARHLLVRYCAWAEYEWRGFSHGAWAMATGGAFGAGMLGMAAVLYFTPAPAAPPPPTVEYRYVPTPEASCAYLYCGPID